MLLFAFAIFAISLLYALYCVPFPTFVPLSLPPFHTLPYTYVCTYILFPPFFTVFSFLFLLLYRDLHSREPGPASMSSIA